MKVYLTGLESSGQKWARRCLSQHPELNVCGDSAPTGWASVGRQYDYSHVGCDVMVVITRDQTCHQRSVKNLGYNRGMEGKFTDEESKVHILNQTQSAPKVIWISYEAIMCYQQDYWDWVFSQLGVEPILVETDYRDGNAKYFQ